MDFNWFLSACGEYVCGLILKSSNDKDDDSSDTIRQTIHQSQTMHTSIMNASAFDIKMYYTSKVIETTMKLHLFISNSK